MAIRIEDTITEWADREGHQLDLSKARAIGGGSINEAWQVEFNGAHAFLKVARETYPNMFAEEAAGLHALREVGTSFRIPEVYHVDDAFLLLEYIPTKSTSAADDARAGRALAEMHQLQQACWGYPRDNYIATLPQCNTNEKYWSTFFTQHRLRPLLKGSIAIENIDLEKLLDDVAIYIRYKVSSEHPVLLHGDLWSGNRITDTNGLPVLVDPAVYFGHREMDIAMTVLFGGFGQRFYEAYEEVWPLEEGWRERTLLCNLYPLLVHEHLFGLSYGSAVRTNLVELGLLT